MVLIDTSAWIESLRKNGRPDVKARVEAYLISGMARLCPPVIIELLNGAKGKAEKEILNEMIDNIAIIEPDNETWLLCYKYIQDLRKEGVTIPNIDVIIKAIADRFNCEILTLDKHFEKMSFLQVVI